VVALQAEYLELLVSGVCLVSAEGSLVADQLLVVWQVVNLVSGVALQVEYQEQVV
jgi:hypothetical protein